MSIFRLYLPLCRTNESVSIVTISQLVVVPTSPSTLEPSTHSDQHRQKTTFVMLTSDGRAYLVKWGPPPTPDHSESYTPTSSASPSVLSSPTKSSKANPFSHLPYNHPGYATSSSTTNVLFDYGNGTGQSEMGGNEINEGGGPWEWTGVCFHPDPAMVKENDDEEYASQEWVDGQEKELDRGKGASTSCFNEKMDLIAIGCEE